MLSSRKYDEAIDAFIALGSYKDASSRVLDARYQLAGNLVSKEDYIGAVAIFNSLGNFKDASLKTAEYITGLIKQGVAKDLPFGTYKWRVLEVKDSTALLVTEQIIGNALYNSDRKSVTWENCLLRSFLNGDFYNEFSNREKSLIVTSDLPNPSNSEHGTEGGIVTSDKVFLLSVDDSKQCFAGNNDRTAKQKGSAVWRWLRSPSGDSQYAAGVEELGSISHGGNGVNSVPGIRPALYIKL